MSKRKKNIFYKQIRESKFKQHFDSIEWALLFGNN